MIKSTNRSLAFTSRIHTEITEIEKLNGKEGEEEEEKADVKEAHEIVASLHKVGTPLTVLPVKNSSSKLTHWELT